jgi:hypothetical protein
MQFFYKTSKESSESNEWPEVERTWIQRAHESSDTQWEKAMLHPSWQRQEQQFKKWFFVFFDS